MQTATRNSHLFDLLSTSSTTKEKMLPFTDRVSKSNVVKCSIKKGS